MLNIASTINTNLPSSATIIGRHTQPELAANIPSTRLAEGGSISASHQLADYEEFELADFAGLQRHKEQGARYLKREAKRVEKIRQLDEADEMKFSHSIQFNAVPDWSSHYIAYSNLKKLYAPGCHLYLHHECN